MPLAHPINSLKISTLKTGCFLEEMADDSDNIIKKSAEKSHQPAADQICPGPIKFSLYSSTVWTCGSQGYSHCKDSVVAYWMKEMTQTLSVPVTTCLHTINPNKYPNAIRLVSRRTTFHTFFAVLNFTILGPRTGPRSVKYTGFYNQEFNLFLQTSSRSLVTWPRISMQKNRAQCH